VLAPENLSPKPKSYTVRTKSELDTLLNDETFSSAACIQLVEVIMDKVDAPLPLVQQAELSVRTNCYAAEML
jgi:pyruvate decarboxylase